MEFSHFCEQVVDVPPNINTRRLNAGNNLKERRRWVLYNYRELVTLPEEQHRAMYPPRRY